MTSISEALAKEGRKAPEGFAYADGKAAAKEYKYTMQVSAYDCTGCGSCANVCPAKEKALVLKPIEDEMQCALAVTEPVTANGVYLLEIEDGYFEDRNGNPVKGMTLNYIV